MYLSRTLLSISLISLFATQALSASPVEKTRLKFRLTVWEEKEITLKNGKKKSVTVKSALPKFNKELKAMGLAPLPRYAIVQEGAGAGFTSVTKAIRPRPWTCWITSFARAGRRIPPTRSLHT